MEKQKNYRVEFIKPILNRLLTFVFLCVCVNLFFDILFPVGKGALNLNSTRKMDWFNMHVTEDSKMLNTTYQMQVHAEEMWFNALVICCLYS